MTGDLPDAAGRFLSMIDAILFDLDETLLDRTGSLQMFLVDQYQRFHRLLGAVDCASWCQRFLSLDGRGLVAKSIVYPAILSAFGGEPAAATMLLNDYETGCNRYARAFAGTIETLQTLRQSGFGLGVVTNGATAFQTLHLDALGLSAVMDVILISEAEGLRKPDRQLFLRAADRLNTSPARCLFVGDHPETDILGARGAGMKTAWLCHGSHNHGSYWPAHLGAPPDLTMTRIDVLPGFVSRSGRAPS